jgi:CBS domain-containing protein
VDELTSRFLDAFAGIEQWLQNQDPEAVRRDFVRLVDAVARINPVVRRHAAALRELSAVRNVLVHHYNEVRPLAVPSEHAVRQIVAIRKELLTPTLLLSLAATPVKQCAPTDPVGVSVRKMHAGSFSQLPVYDGRECLGLLTAETVARWLAVHLADGGGLIEEQPVGDVLRHQESPENLRLMPRSATAADGLAAFDQSQCRGQRLDAILINQAGRAGDPPLGIVTIYDLPKLQRAIED